MAARTYGSSFSSLVAEDVDAIEPCPCDEEDEYEKILRPRLPSFPIYPDSWEPIVVYRKNKKKYRCVHIFNTTMYLMIIIIIVMKNIQSENSARLLLF